VLDLKPPAPGQAKVQEQDTNSPGKTRAQVKKATEEKVPGESKTGSTRARSPSQVAVEEKMTKKATLQTTLKISSNPLTRSMGLEMKKPAHMSTGLKNNPTTK
jgi:hypothetical protein